MPSPAPDPLTSRPLSVWLVDPFDDIPGEGLPPRRSWSLARVLADRGHDVTWWTATWSQRRKAIRTAPLGIREDEGFGVRLVAVRPYDRDLSLARLGSHRDFGLTFERLANESVASGQLERPDVIVATMPPLDGPESALRLARKLDATFILDVLDLWPEALHRFLPGPGFVKRLASRFLLGGMSGRRHSLIAAADGLAAATTLGASAAFASAPADTPRHVCRIGVYVDEFPRPAHAAEPVPAPGQPGGGQSAARPLEVIHAGGMEAGTGVEALPAVVRHLAARNQAATIHVVGAGRLEASLRRAGTGSGTARLEVHGPLGRQDYVRLLSRCDVGIVSGVQGPEIVMPSEVFEYAAAGLAIVAGQSTELSGLLAAHDAGLDCETSDPSVLARSLSQLHGDRGRLAALRQGARRMAEREFDREKTYAAFADWIETIRGGG